MKVVSQNVEYLGGTPDPLKLIEAAGRTCYKSEDKITCDSAEEFVRMIVDRGHDSVLEHASATFRITTDRGTNAFPGKRVPNIMKEAHRMAQANDLGFFHGMKSYSERLSRALIYLGRNN